MLAAAMQDGSFPQAGPLLFAWAVAAVVLAGWLWRAGRIPDRYLAAVDAGLVPLIAAGTLLIARADLASLVLVFGVSLPLAIFMYRVTVPFLEGRLARNGEDSAPQSLNEWLARTPRRVRVPSVAMLAVVFAAPSVLVLMLVVTFVWSR